MAASIRCDCIVQSKLGAMLAANSGDVHSLWQFYLQPYRGVVHPDYLVTILSLRWDTIVYGPGGRCDGVILLC